jgi:CMP-N-acetylneuraminic acid synthetase
MSKSPVVYAMIPARFGSTRLKMKNLALINNKPMISYAIEAAIESDVFNKVVLNSENDIFKEIAERHNVDFYHRSSELGSSQAKSDLVVADFMHKFPEADIVAWVNPISPFQTSDEIMEVINYFIKTNLDSLITVEEKQVHCNFNNEPVNYSLEGVFEQTQDLKPTQPFVYSIMMWKSKKFLNEFDNKGFGLFCGKFSTYPVSKLSSIIIKNKQDLMLADFLMQAVSKDSEKYNIKYDNLVNIKYRG